MVNPSTRLRMNVILCGFGLAAPGVFRYLLGQVDNLAVFTHDDLAHAPGLTRQAQTAGVWHTTESINKSPLPFEPDMVISIYYRHIIKRHIIEACRGRIFNAHPSLLPRHRGCSSIPWAMIYQPLPPAKLGDFEVRSMDDYYKALGERYRESLLAR